MSMLLSMLLSTMLDGLTKSMGSKFLQAIFYYFHLIFLCFTASFYFQLFFFASFSIFTNLIILHLVFILDGNVFVVTRKEPVGVAGQIIPWVFKQKKMSLFSFIMIKILHDLIEFPDFDALLEMGPGFGCRLYGMELGESS